MQNIGILFASFFKSQPQNFSVPLDTVLVGTHVVLRMGDAADWKEWRALRDISRDFLVPWEPSWPENGLTHSFYCGLVRRHWRDWRQGKAYTFLIFEKTSSGKKGRLLGGIALNDVQRGISRKGTLGYWVGQPYAGQGIMTEAASLVCDFAFHTLKLNRVEASCLPHNERSKKLLQRIGFDEEGYAKAYLQINGQWQDHVLWGRTATSSPLAGEDRKR